MKQEIVILSEKEIAAQFAEAICRFNLDILNELLHDDGEYQAEYDIDDNPKVVIKSEYLNWIFDELIKYKEKTSAKIEYKLDQCLYCRIGNPVILFNDGTFPIKTTENSLKEKLGLMLEFLEGKICGITYCGYFMQTDNRFRYENYKDEI